MLLLVVHKLFGFGDERAATAEAGQHPSELETEDVEKEVDVARKVLVPEHAALAESVVGGEVCFLPEAAAFFRVAAASGASTSSGRRAGGASASAAAENETTTSSAARGSFSGPSKDKAPRNLRSKSFSRPGDTCPCA